MISTRKLIKILNKNPLPENAAVIFDIDGTLIKLNGKPISNIVNFYKYCVSQSNITTFIVTARPVLPHNISATIKQLEKVGVVDFQSIFFMKTIFHNPVKYKLFARKNIKEMGYNTDNVVRR